MFSRKISLRGVEEPSPIININRKLSCKGKSYKTIKKGENPRKLPYLFFKNKDRFVWSPSKRRESTGKSYKGRRKYNKIATTLTDKPAYKVLIKKLL